MTHKTPFQRLGLASHALALLFCVVGHTDAQVPYPFEVPDEISATLRVNRTKKTPVNHMLLGLNCNWPEGLYGKSGYNNPEAQKLIRTLKPSSLRFPHGVWSNFYDWESDGRRMTNNYKTPYDSAVKDHPDLKYGFDGFHALHRELRFDVLFTWNVNYDRPAKGVRRLIDRRSKGFEVKWIELGNEIFWKTQRSEAVEDVGKYIEVSRAHAMALKEVAPKVKVSVPIHWRNPLSDPWNTALMKQDYYDAITVHKHMGNPETREGAAQTLAAKRVMVDMAQTLRTVFPRRPLWVSEWSVSCGNNAISILGMADIYLGFFEQPEVFAMADYFQINASHALIEFDKASHTHARTSYGAAYEIVRGVFENSELYESSTDSTAIGDGIDAVSAAAVSKHGEVIVFAINKAPCSVPLKVAFDGADYSRPCTHKSLFFEELNQLKYFGLEDSVLTEVKTATKSPSGGILLPPLSINRIDGLSVAP